MEFADPDQKHRAGSSLSARYGMARPEGSRAPHTQCYEEELRRGGSQPAHETYKAKQKKRTYRRSNKVAKSTVGVKAKR
jgi:hypothetical protein